MDQAQDAPRPQPLSAQLDLEYTDRVNLAIQQLGTPLIDAVILKNTGDAPLEDITLTARLAGVDLEPWTARLASLEPGRAARIIPDRWRLTPAHLAARTEAERTTIDLEARATNFSLTRSFDIDLLPFDHWPGQGHLPEVTAAFVTPNHSLVAQLLRGARTALASRSERDAIDGYQSASRQRAALIAESCFLSLAEQRIGYINPPASFERSGQRVRLIDRVLRERLGTCLDLSLLLMSLWEQAGLHALLLLPEGHAMPAFWTHPASLPEAVIDEPSRIRNLIELGEIVAVESTHATHQSFTFAAAVEAARKAMHAPGATFCAIDLKACRKRGIRPLPLLEGDRPAIDPVALSNAAPQADPAALTSVLLADRAETTASTSQPITAPAESGSQRIARWQSRLLDLSLRNRLINFKDSLRSLPLSVPAIAPLEDRLAAELSVRILAQTDADAAFRAEELSAGRIYSACTEAETQKRLLTIYRAALASIEETGANLLHLALGSLVWYESPSAETPRRAPLLMIPVRLARAATGAGYAYTLTLSDEPVRPNITLLEKIHSEFGIDTKGLAELPEDDAGIDVPMILRNFRSAIRDARRWEVEETAHLGLFSFNKFLMWRDLKENLTALRANRMVDHLVERPGQPFDDTPFPAADTLDTDLAPGKPLCTRDADSSQIVAVVAASQGRSFVLEGPPGTGKSQTIANMIADALASNKRVLFVAEKLAALSVVRKRLEHDGLGPFCLELHSAKASKKEVLEQLRAALDAKPAPPHADWNKHCAALGAARDRLNAYVSELHRVRPSGESLFSALATLTDLGEQPQVEIPAPDITQTTADQLTAWREAVHLLAERTRPIGSPANHPLAGIGLTDWDFDLPARATTAITSAHAALDDLRIATESWLSAALPSITPAHLSLTDLETLTALAQLLLESPNPPRALLEPNAAALLARLRHAITLGRQRDTLRAKLADRYHPELETLDHLPHIAAAKAALDQIAPIRFFRARAIRAKLRAYATATLPPLAQLLQDLESARELKRLSAELTSLTDLAAHLGPRWNNANPDWNALESLADWCDRFTSTADPLRANAPLHAALIDLATDEPRTRATAAPARALITAHNAWSKAWSVSASTLSTDTPRAFAQGKPDWLARAHATLTRWHAGLADLNNWCVYNHAKSHTESLGLTDLTTKHAAGLIPTDALSPALEASYAAKWFTALANTIPAIRTFNADLHESQIQRFRDLDKDAITLTRAVVAEHLAAAAPSASVRAAAQSEVGILRRELEKKSRHLPTRRLIERLPSLLPRLKPCFLMSPLSIAQFLDPSMPGFDIVIFDEASQIPVWDAVGAIARGKEVIVVGDSKQLPPTSFFRATEGESDAPETPDDAADDMESILKECNASGIPSLRLKWHYRSRHESLIAFSNHHYYHNQLMTFPSPTERSPEMGVTFRHVPDAIYDRADSRTNPVEARRVVDDVLRMLTDPSDHDSIGIVTFNQPQQTLIQDLLDAKRRENPEIERFFTTETEEPVFVKNLENVQGDERDTILFSIGYGPDAEGRVSMNFGPLNQDGGERRLNVAVTRARRRLTVFSSITSDMIDLRRTRVTGVAHFKRFLDYAQRGPEALEEAAAHSESTRRDHRLEHALRQKLTERGHEVDANVGCAAYRVDLAIRDPNNPGAYLLGIECDGHHYRAASTARDRDRTRPAVLKGLGWNLHRVWSVQWRINPQSCLDQIEAALARAREAKAAPRPEPTAPPPAPLVASAPPAAKSPAARPTAANTYRVATPGRHRVGQRDIYAPESDDLLKRWLTIIVETEAPILRPLATRRLAAFCGLAAVRDRFRQRAGDILSKLTAAGALQLTGDTLWNAGDDPAAYRQVRQPGPEPETRRDADQIPPEEYRAAVIAVVKEQFGLPRADLAREAAAKLGFARLTTALTPPVDNAIASAIEAGLITDSGDTIGLGTTP